MQNQNNKVIIRECLNTLFNNQRNNITINAIEKTLSSSSPTTTTIGKRQYLKRTHLYVAQPERLLSVQDTFVSSCLNNNKNSEIAGSKLKELFGESPSFQQISSGWQKFTPSNHKTFASLPEYEIEKAQILEMESNYFKNLIKLEKENELTNVIDAYYNLLEKTLDEPLSLGTIFFYGLDNQDIKNQLINQLIGLDLFDKALDIPVMVHCKRATSSSIQLLDSYSVSIGGDYNLKDIKKEIYDYCGSGGSGDQQSSSPSTTVPKYSKKFLEIVVQSPTIYNMTMVNTPSFQSLGGYSNNELSNYLPKLIGWIPYQERVFVMCHDNKSVAGIEDDALFGSRMDPFYNYTIGVINSPSIEFARQYKFERSSFPLPDGFIPFSTVDPTPLSYFKERLFKIFLKKIHVQQHIKQMITKSITGQGKLFQQLIKYQGLSLSKNQDKKNKMIVQFESLASPWSNESKYIKLYLEKQIESKIFERLTQTFEIISQQSPILDLNRESVDFKNCFIKEDPVNIDEFFNSLRITFKEQQGHQQQQSTYDMIKRDWALFAKFNSLLPYQLIKEQQSKFMSALEKEMDFISPTTEHLGSELNLVYYSWLMDYRRCISSILSSGLMDSDMPELVYQSYLNSISFAFNNSFTDNINDSLADALELSYNNNTKPASIANFTYHTIQKEILPSITLDEFLDAYLNSPYKDQRIPMFSTTWNIVYLKAVSRKLSKEIVSLININIIQPWLYRSIQTTIQLFTNLQIVLEKQNKNWLSTKTPADLLISKLQLKANMSFDDNSDDSDQISQEEDNEEQEFDQEEEEEEEELNKQENK
ncbi:hypothetical protein CYY_003955 [Polysphondylium violaceum]|uniref:Uncharacterized protein n=1 Tax=Polysphondylium violaceum TaxID=133409 RepID=A0A8J4PVC4_9MYCE|nr:hypothetical protein CYY_003955 [Polysphondylium violaceum]